MTHLVMLMAAMMALLMVKYLAARMATSLALVMAVHSVHCLAPMMERC